jgi:excisionase family DNA binding protein
MEKVLTTSDAAKILGVNRSRVLQLIMRGKLRAEKLGWQWIIRPKDLEKVKNRKPGRPKKMSSHTNQGR